MLEGYIMLRHQSDHEPTVIGLFSNAGDARRAMNNLREQHFSNGEVHAAFRDPDPSPEESGSGRWFGQLRQLYHGENRGEDAVGGGPGDFQALLAQLDLSREDSAVFNGEAIVTVNAGGRNEGAQSLLEQCGARILSGRTLQEQATAPTTPEPAVTSAPFTPPREADPGKIQLFGEVLRVRKEKVSSGEIHVRKETVTHMETVEVPVTREHLVVEHTHASGRIDAEDTIRVPLSEERLHIDKETVLTEEYKVGKRQVTQNQSVTDSVRKERLLVDDAEAQIADRET
jgi:uncharacterized protein (TIGR02271 family)